MIFFLFSCNVAWSWCSITRCFWCQSQFAHYNCIATKQYRCRLNQKWNRLHGKKECGATDFLNFKYYQAVEMSIYTGQKWLMHYNVKHDREQKLQPCIESIFNALLRFQWVRCCFGAWSKRHYNRILFIIQFSTKQDCRRSNAIKTILTNINAIH